MSVDPAYLKYFKEDVGGTQWIVMYGFNEDGVLRDWDVAITSSIKVVKGLEKHAEDLVKLIAILNRCQFKVTRWREGRSSDNYPTLQLDT